TAETDADRVRRGYLGKIDCQSWWMTFAEICRVEQISADDLVAIVIVVMPLPTVFAVPVLIAVDAFPSPIVVGAVPAALVSAIPAIVILVRHYAVVVLSEGIARINTVRAVVVSAGVVAREALGIAGAGKPGGQCRE